MIFFALKDFEVAAVTIVIADLEQFHSIGMRLGGVVLPEGNVSFGGNGGLVVQARGRPKRLVGGSQSPRAPSITAPRSIAGCCRGGECAKEPQEAAPS